MGLLQTVRGWFGGAGVATLDPDRDDLVVVVRGFDEVQACSAALDEAHGWVRERPALLRHHLVVPAAGREQAVATAAQDGYAPDSRPPADGADVVLVRVQLLDALHCSQERSRMAGLAQRLGGHVLGWDALQPAPEAGSPSR